MEQLVLGIFQEHLAKFIIGFRKEQVNANLLNGKGEIKNVELNCAALNAQIMKVSPYIELESVHVSRLSFHVTSWANLRQSPICIDVEHVTATIAEPLHFLDRRRRRRLRQITRHELAELIREGTVPKPRTGRYNLLDRILDNLTVEIQSIDVTFQPAGKFKTRRVGPWTPPALRLQLFGVRLVSVTEFGHEASPDEVWRHNHHHHHHHHRKKVGGGAGGRDASFLIYKKLETEYKISIVLSKTATRKNANGESSSQEVKGGENGKEKESEAESGEGDNDDDELVIPIVSSTPKDGTCNNQSKVQVQLAFQRRIRDGEYLAVQVETTIPVVEIEVVASTIPHLAHFLAAVTYLLAKDRAFADPLRAASSPHANAPAISPTIVKTASSESLGPENQGEEVGLTAESLMDMAMADGLSESSEDDDEGEDEGDKSKRSADNSIVEEGSEGSEYEVEIDSGTMEANELVAGTESVPVTAQPTEPTTRPIPQTPATHGRVPQSREDRPVLVLPNGIILHDKISLSVSVHHVTIRGTYRESVDGHIQIVAKGVVAEAIWPQVTNERGGYLQASVSYVAIQERFQRRIRPLLVGGAQYDNTGPVEKPAKPLGEVGCDETFPLYEDRSVRPDPFGLRHTFPAQALGFKLTVSYCKKLGIDSDDPPTDETMFLNELGVDQFDVVLDSAAWCRLLRFALNVEGGGFDPRWHSGDWSGLLTTDMLQHPSVPLNLEECLQPRKQIFLDENHFLSSDLFNATVRVTNTGLKIPATVEEDVRSCDVHLQVRETMIIVSSALPRSLLNRAIDDDSIRFPHDPSDAAYTLESAEDPSNRQRGIMTSRAISTFRAQLTVRGYSIRLKPIIPLHTALESEQLLLPSEMTMIVCFEGEPPADGSQEGQTKIVLFTSVIAHRFELNIDFDRIASAVGTVSLHVEKFVETARACVDLFSGGIKGDVSDSEPTESSNAEGSDPGDSRIRKTLRGRKVLVHRQLIRSRETGGLVVAACVQVAEIRTCFWRQHVPRDSPLRSRTEDSREFVPLLCLLDSTIKLLDFGVEVSLRQQDKRLVLKCGVDEISVSICDFKKIIERPCIESESRVGLTDFCHSTCMVDILSSKRPESDQRAVAFRAQEVLGTVRSWSISTDFSNVTVDCQIDAVETAGILFLEALLMPTWRQPRDFVGKSPMFPPDSVGDLFLSLIPNVPPLGETVSLGVEDGIFLHDSGLTVSGDSVDLALRTLFTRFVPKTVDALLVRFGLHNALIALPNGMEWGKSNAINGNENFGLQLCDSEFCVSYFASQDAIQAEMLNVLARDRDKWSSIILSDAKGLCHSLQSRQSFLSSKPSSHTTSMKSLVDAFDFSYSYGNSKITLSVSDDVSIGNPEQLEAFFVFLLLFKKRCNDIARNAIGILKIVSSRGAANREPVEDSNPISVACSSSIASVLSARAWLRRASENWGLYDQSTSSVLTTKDKEIALLRLALFVAEKERLGALALVESQACGWLKLGAARRSGQRGLMTGTLFPHWVVLRRSLLILYAAPGQHNVLGYVHLKDASLRELSGGQRKRDLKRAFAVVEANKTVHFVVTVNDADYINWLQKLREAIRFYSLNGGPDGSEEDIRNAMGAQLGNSRALDSSTHSRTSQTPDSTDPPLSSSNHGRPIGRSISRAVAKVKGRKSDSTMVTDSQESSVGDTESLTETISSNVDQTSGQAATWASSESLDQNRRQQLRTRFAGVGQATKKGLGSASQVTKKGLGSAGQLTKNRFGAALQVAKQKGKQAVEKRRNRTQSESNDEHLSASVLGTDGTETSTPTADSWPCPACTFLNPPSSTQCTMCESLRPSDLSSNVHSQNVELGSDERMDFTLEEEVDAFSDLKEGTVIPSRPSNAEHSSTSVENQSHSPSLNARQDEKIVSMKLEENSEIIGRDDLSVSGRSDRSVTSDINDADGDDASERGLQRRGVKQRLGAVVQRASKARADRKSLRAGIEGAPVGAPKSVKLKNISVGGPLATPVHPFGECGQAIQDTPLKRLEGFWFVRVEMKYPSGVDATDEPARDAIESADTPSHSTIGEDEKGETDHTNPLSETAPAGCVDVTEVIERTFQIDVFQREDDRTSKVASIVRSLPEVASLHTSLSQSISRVPFYRYDGDESAERSTSSVGGMNNQLSMHLGLTTLDKVRLTGKLLGGLLEMSLSSYDNLDGHCKHQADVVSEFLNAMLDSLLPVDSLLLLSDFLQLTDASTSNQDTELSRLELPFARAAEIHLNENQRLERANEVLSSTSLCENELLRAEKQTLLAERLSHLKKQSTNELLKREPSETVSYLVGADQPHSASDQFRDAMHAALMTVMEERDEAHARMLSAEVLHVHQMEQQRKKAENLSTELELLKKSAPTNGARARNNQNENGPDQETVRKLERQHDTDAELISLCQQLAGEISARTSASLEIVRLKESRKIEQENEAIEKQALKDEITQLRQQLAQERKKSLLARRESGSWRESFHEAVLVSEGGGSPPPSPSRQQRQFQREGARMPADVSIHPDQFPA